MTKRPVNMSMLFLIIWMFSSILFMLKRILRGEENFVFPISIFILTYSLLREIMDQTLKDFSDLIRQTEIEIPHIFEHYKSILNTLLRDHVEIKQITREEYENNLQPFFPSFKIKSPSKETLPVLQFHCSQLLVLDEMLVSSHSFQLSGIEMLPKNCLLGMIAYFLSLDSILHVSLLSSPMLMNYDVKGYIQTGDPENHLFNEIGLNGANQIVGVADSGVNDLSCFFMDNYWLNRKINDNNLEITRTTSRNGQLESFRRKIIQYVPYADGVDDRGGHGTHVCGTIVGDSSLEFSQMNGIASKAKISFYDIGYSALPMLKIPPLTAMFDTTYQAGARVHSNSWGGFGGIYTSMSFELDRYLYEHDDFLAIFAAGNNGILGLHSISIPGNAKNCLTIGAGEMKDMYSDQPLEKNKYNVASYSSLGPTYDGRYKPDIIAPGDSVISAYAGDPACLQRAINLNTSNEMMDFDEQCPMICGVHANSGTSMATPLVSGSALLLRQYLMESPFICDESNYLFYEALRKEENLEALKEWKCSFTPSGYFLKGMLIHSADRVFMYSDDNLNNIPTIWGPMMFSTMHLGRQPDNFQGYGSVKLANIISKDFHQRNVETMFAEQKNAVLRKKLLFWDKLEISEQSTIEIVINMTTASHNSFFKHDNQQNEKPNNRPLSLKVTTCWFDPPNPFSFLSKLLLNDIDLYVRLPYQYDGTHSSLNSPTTRPFAGPVGLFDTSTTTKSIPEEVLMGKSFRPGDHFYLGNKRNGIFTQDDIVQSFVLPDDKNPNEQILIEDSRCYPKDKSFNNCIYTVIINTKHLPVGQKQKFALFISTYGKKFPLNVGNFLNLLLFS
jgi:hypothetical protein